MAASVTVAGGQAIQVTIGTDVPGALGYNLYVSSVNLPPACTTRVELATTSAISHRHQRLDRSLPVVATSRRLDKIRRPLDHVPHRRDNVRLKLRL